MKKKSTSPFAGVERINRRRFVKHVAVGTVLAFGMGLATSSYADGTGSGSGPYYPPGDYPDPDPNYRYA